MTEPPSSPWKTPAPPWRPTRSPACSNPSIDSPPPSDAQPSAATRGRDSACPSFAPSPTPTAATSTPCPAPTAASSSTCAYQPSSRTTGSTPRIELPHARPRHRNQSARRAQPGQSDHASKVVSASCAPGLGSRTSPTISTPNGPRQLGISRSDSFTRVTCCGWTGAGLAAATSRNCSRPQRWKRCWTAPRSSACSTGVSGHSGRAHWLRRSGIDGPKTASPTPSGRQPRAGGLRALVEQAIAHLANAWALRCWRGLLHRVRDGYRAPAPLGCLARWLHLVPREEHHGHPHCLAPCPSRAPALPLPCPCGAPAVPLACPCSCVVRTPRSAGDARTRGSAVAGRPARMLKHTPAAPRGWFRSSASTAPIPWRALPAAATRSPTATRGARSGLDRGPGDILGREIAMLNFGGRLDIWGVGATDGRGLTHGAARHPHPRRSGPRRGRARALGGLGLRADHRPPPAGRALPERVHRPPRQDAARARAAHHHRVRPTRRAGRRPDVRHRHHPGRSRPPRPGRARRGARTPLGQPRPRQPRPRRHPGRHRDRHGHHRRRPPLLDLLDPSLHGQVVLVVTSLPYGPSIHGQVDARPGGVVKYDNRYAEPGATGRGNLARASDQVLLGAMQQILAACCILLRPGGVLVLTARPWRRRGLLVDFPGALVRAGEHAGLACFERNVALLVGLNGDRLVGRPSFFQLGRVRKARAAGLPLRVIAHEDVLVFRRSQTCAGS